LRHTHKDGSLRPVRRQSQHWGHEQREPSKRGDQQQFKLQHNARRAGYSFQKQHKSGKRRITSRGTRQRQAKVSSNSSKQTTMTQQRERERSGEQNQ
jgi:hypothetical protein